MVTIGGYTRLSKSGLSMTDWKFEGRPLPSTEDEWNVEFDKYKVTPEYTQINYGMTLDEFKYIYFVEWFHRMAGRFTGVVFGTGLAYFLLRGALRPPLLIRLAGLFAFGAMQGGIGWWMVKSGLTEPTTQLKTPRVSPYRLATHLTMAFALYAGCLWTSLTLLRPLPETVHPTQAMVQAARRLRGFSAPLAALLGITLVSGAFVAGNDAGRAYNTWPKMLDDWVPPEVFETLRGGLIRNVFESTPVVQFDHRLLAYATLASTAGLFLTARSLPVSPAVKFAAHLLPAAAFGQVLLGIATLMMYVPVDLGVAHQAGGMLLLSALVLYLHTLRVPLLPAVV